MPPTTLLAKRAKLHFRAAVPDDAAVCVILRGQTRENAVSIERLRSLGITAESWAAKQMKYLSNFIK
jgi:hypothetical protein